MSSSARVTSIEALEDFKVAVCRFRTDAAKALGSVEMELQRILDSLNERAKYWQREVRVRHEEVMRAKSELARRKAFSEGRGRGPGFTEQEEALEEALRRLKQAEEKVEKCRHWSRQIPHAVAEYEGPARQLAGMLDTEVRQAIILLEQKLTALESYTALEAPTGPAPAATGSAAPEANPSPTPPAEPPKP